MRVHAHHAEGEAKFWLDPEIELAHNHGLSRRRVTAALALIRGHEHRVDRESKGVSAGGPDAAQQSVAAGEPRTSPKAVELCSQLHADPPLG